METLANLESFVRSAETGSFSTTAQRLSLTPAAVSRNVAMLERNLGVPVVPPQHTQAPSEGSRRAFPARSPRQSRGVAGLYCERRDRPRRADRRAQGQHGPDLRGRLYCAVTPGVFETISEGPPRLALRESAGGPHRGRARHSNRGGHRTGARCCIAHARAFAHHCRRLAGLSKRPEAAIRSVRACRV